MRAGDHASRTTTAVAKGFKLTGTPAFTLPESRRQQKMVKRAGTSHGVTHSQPARNGNFPETAAHSQHTQRSTDITYAAQTGDKGGGTHLAFAAGASCVVPSITYIVPVPASVGRLNDAAALSLFTSRMRRVPDGDTKACARPQPCSHHGDRAAIAMTHASGHRYLCEQLAAGHACFNEIITCFKVIQQQAQHPVPARHGTC